jgi:hypothetical protein
MINTKEGADKISNMLPREINKKKKKKKDKNQRGLVIKLYHSFIIHVSGWVSPQIG